LRTARRRKTLEGDRSITIERWRFFTTCA
jgi:hypothetical protein